MNCNTVEKSVLLETWAKNNAIDVSELSRVFNMLAQGPRGERKSTDPIQFPSYYIKDEHAKAWHHSSDYPWVTLLNKHYLGIKKEAEKVFTNNLMNVHPENDDLAGYGTWNTFFFYKNGVAHIDHLNQCPITAHILSQISGVNIAGRTYFSAMTPGIHIKSHCGPHNFKLRTHLGLITPPEATIRVGTETRSWQEANCIVFDDSYEHEVWNRSDQTRIVFIVDVWNPSLTKIEIDALQLIMPEFYHSEVSV